MMNYLTKPFFTLVVIAPILISAPAYAKGLTVTTNQGGEISKQHECVQGNTVVTCESLTTGTTAAGETVSRQVLRSNDGSGTDTDITFTGPDGATVDRSRGIIVNR